MRATKSKSSGPRAIVKKRQTEPRNPESSHKKSDKRKELRIDVPGEIKIKPCPIELAKILPELRKATGENVNSKALLRCAMKFIDHINEINELRAALKAANYRIGVITDITRQMFTAQKRLHEVSEEISKATGQMSIDDLDDLDDLDAPDLFNR